MTTELSASTPAAAWRELMTGNERFINGAPMHPNQDLDRRAATAAEPQRPFAAVFGCMDSRVAAEIIFDRGIGDLAVIRTAGHTVDNAVLGSLEFGVVGLEIPLILVLGHDNCGAVKAAVDAYETGKMPTGYLRDLVERLSSSFITARHLDRTAETGTDAATAQDSTSGTTTSINDDMINDAVMADTVMVEHVRHTVHLLAERSVAIAERITDGRLAVAGAGYRLAEGRVTAIDHVGPID